ncbi:hypothetical protein D9757_012245 [Collybiopsis confluens]|uniref:Uncharacterized protein n=1 Tax=Collybiopsis confluens TaxID=2823264 RepID=A0A8H5LIT1_9AGAR|nr:hypothetical protein D9757_012245 [Collybiopsis confluens]
MRPKKDADRDDAEDMTSDSGDDKVFSMQDPFKIPGYLVGLSPDIVTVYRRVLEINKVEDLEVFIRDFEFSTGMRWALLLLDPVPESPEQGSSNIVRQPQSKRKRAGSTAAPSSSKRSKTQEASGRRTTRQMKNSQQAGGSEIGATDPPEKPADDPADPAENLPANQEELALQCGRYAKAALSKGQFCSHVIGMVLDAGPGRVLFRMQQCWTVIDDVSNSMNFDFDS